MSNAAQNDYTYKAVQLWLYFVCFMVFAMGVIGAITRLTESGLSMVEWRPLVGTIPPLSAAEWQRVFDLYRQTGEYRHEHYWMELEDFKYIFFWEWLHRVWGRLIGVVYALPLLYFWVRRQIPAGYGWKLTGLLCLGGLQGVIGWWMVQSGLVDRVDVSHYRLAVHLGLAFIIFGLTWWLALGLRGEEERGEMLDVRSEEKDTGDETRPSAHSLTSYISFPHISNPYISHLGWGLLALLALTIIWGAFVAGLEAGKLYNTWPLMNGHILPPEKFDVSSIIEQHGWVQFVHRWLGFVTGLGILIFALRLKSYWLAGMVSAQVIIGIATLLTALWIPLAALHQAGALILLALLLNSLHRLQVSRTD